MGLASLGNSPDISRGIRIAMDDSRAVLSAALMAVAPGFALTQDAAPRVANDSLAIALAALLCWLVMRKSHWVAIGLALGAGLFTKAYFPGIIDRCAHTRDVAGRRARDSGRRWMVPAKRADRRSGQRLAGSEGVTIERSLHAAREVNWFDATRVTAKSFFWFGAWSFLTLKSWIYSVMDIVGLFAAIRGFNRQLLVPWVFVACVFAEMAFGVLNYQAIHGIGSIPGWYAWVVGGMLAMIMAAGLGRATWFLVGALVAIDIYGITLMSRHYHW